ncbi:MAG: TatD family hydrolase [Bacteroides sp.]|nr:TatD family hydrolase [Bacteroides sp.]
MEILDIHTHHVPENGKQAILNIVLKSEDGSDQIPERLSSLSLLSDGYFSIGFHPWYISAQKQQNWELLMEAANLPQVLAIGEAGLDKLTETDLTIQETVFRKQIEISEELHKPLIIHAVRTFNEIVQWKKKIKPAVPWIIHGFRGKKEMAKELIDHGFYLSFGEKYQDESLLSVPVEKIFLETDESKRAITTLYTEAARILSCPINELIDKVQQNIAYLFFES